MHTSSVKRRLSSCFNWTCTRKSCVHTLEQPKTWEGGPFAGWTRLRVGSGLFDATSKKECWPFNWWMSVLTAQRFQGFRSNCRLAKKQKKTRKMQQHQFGCRMKHWNHEQECTQPGDLVDLSMLSRVFWAASGCKCCWLVGLGPPPQLLLLLDGNCLSNKEEHPSPWGVFLFWGGWAFRLK